MTTAIASIYSPISHRPQKKQKMSLTQTYFLAHTARGKLAKEASRGDHDLRLLVGHANLLDTLMLDLANAEQEQENWFNQSLSGAKAAEASQSPAKHIRWADAVIEEDSEEEYAESSDSDSDSDDDEEETMTATSVTIVKPEKIPTTITTMELTEEYEEDDEEDYEALALTRTSSHHPPELTSDSDEESDDESMPPSPPSATFDAFTETQRRSIATTSYYDKKATSDHQLSESEQSAFFEDGFYLPSRGQPAVIAAY